MISLGDVYTVASIMVPFKGCIFLLQRQSCKIKISGYFVLALEIIQTSFEFSRYPEVSLVAADQIFVGILERFIVAQKNQMIKNVFECQAVTAAFFIKCNQIFLF